MEQQAAGFGVEQSGDEVGGRFAGGLANDAREVGGRNRQLTCIKPDVVLLLVVGDEEPDELLGQLFGVAEVGMAVGSEGNRFEYLQQHYVQQVVQNTFLIGTRVHDVAGDLLQVGSQRLGHRVMQVQYGRLGLAEEERVLSVGRVGGQQPFKQGAFAQQMQRLEVGALPGERDQQAGPEEQHVVGGHRLFPVVQREGGRPLSHQHHREDVGKNRRYGVDVYQLAVHLETGQTVLIYLSYLVILGQFTQPYDVLFHRSAGMDFGR